MAKRKTLIIISSVAVVSAIAYIIYKRNDNKTKIKVINDILDGAIKDPNTGGGQNILSPADISKLPIGSFPLRVGDKNQKVAALQQALNKNYGTSIDVDGKFGEGTFNIVCTKYWRWTPCTTPSSTPPFYQHRSITATDFEGIISGK